MIKPVCRLACALAWRTDQGKNAFDIHRKQQRKLQHSASSAHTPTSHFNRTTFFQISFFSHLLAHFDHDGFVLNQLQFTLLRRAPPQFYPCRLHSQAKPPHTYSTTLTQTFAILLKHAHSNNSSISSYLYCIRRPRRAFLHHRFKYLFTHIPGLVP